MVVLKKLGGIRFSALMALFAAVMMLFCLILPYLSVTELGEATNYGSESLSLVDLALQRNEVFGDEILGWIYVTLLGMIGAFGVLTVLFTLMYKAIPTGIFTLLAAGAFYLISLDFTQRQVVGGGIYEFGIAFYTFCAAAVVAVGCSIWMLVEKIGAKKAAKKEK